MEPFKREDYIYLRFIVNDNEDDYNKDNDDFIRYYKEYKKGDIVRYKKEWLLKKMIGRRFQTCFNIDSVIWEKNPDADENDLLFDKVYKSVTVDKDTKGTIYLWLDDYFYLDEWLFDHIDEDGFDLINFLDKDILSDKNKSNKLIKLNKGCPEIDAKMYMYFNKGEKIDFKIPDVAAIFYNLDWLKMFAHTEIITGEEKEKIFEDDFSNAIYAPIISDYCSFCDSTEIHYFKLKNDIKVKLLKEIAPLVGEEILSDLDYGIIKDNSGYVTYIYTFLRGSYDNSWREREQLLLKIADRIPAEDAIKIHENARIEYKKMKEEENKAFLKKYEEREKKLEDDYQKVKNDPELFPGVNGNFMHKNTKLNGKQKYSLKQIKEFYQNLKTINPELLEHTYFYGGSIPYVLTDSSSSRDFGDIDIFVSIDYIDKFRDEVVKQESFEMICDSKPYAESCMLTSRINKNTEEIVLSKNNNQLFRDRLINILTPREYKKNYIDKNGFVHNPLTEDREDELPYYREIQDFGFKAKLFGVDISVFPIYEYKNNIMAKSFNINNEHQFLLGVKILNNTRIKEFIKKVKANGVSFNILPLEYTIVSKQSALDEKYQSRYEKDKQDVEYILSHKDELGISDDKIKEILANYPDYSISIAYEVCGDITITMNGEEYKKLVLTNRNIS